MPLMTQAVTDNDFAYSAELETETGKPYYQLNLPETVYKNVSRSDLGDIRVINGDGHVVPHGLRAIQSEKTKNTEAFSAPFFPLFQTGDETDSDFHLNIKRNESGDVIDIQSRPITDGGNSRLLGYLVDVREWDKDIDNIQFNWKAIDSASFIRSLSVYSSEDMTNWQLLADDRSLVNLSYQDYQLKNNSMQINAVKAAYLKLVFTDNKPAVEAETIQILKTHSSEQQAINYYPVAVNKTEMAGEYTFQFDLKTVAKKIRIALPEDNSVVKVTVLSRADEKQAWQFRGSDLLYRLTVDGVTIKQTDIDLSSSGDLYWKLNVDQQGGGLGSGLPVIEFAWQPQQLVFVARGKPPYYMLWGSARVKPVLQNAAGLLVSSNSEADTMTGPAHWRADSVRTVNMDALEPETVPVNWRHWLLWAVMISAALILVWMALGLMKKMNES
ncbi:MAG: DUF3999 domain-containing protein [Gammaproteobacteria bacterium]|nr:DUF3999 domain-containing protein [Gammaproteobacteria bacterium]